MFAYLLLFFIIFGMRFTQLLSRDMLTCFVKSASVMHLLSSLSESSCCTQEDQPTDSSLASQTGGSTMTG